MKRTKSELHTHLFGMLSAKELLKMVSEYVDFIYWPLNKSVDKNSRLVNINDLLNNEETLKQLQIKHGDQVSGEELDVYYQARTAIVTYLISILYLTNGKKNCKFQDIVYDMDLKDKLVKYYDFSYEDKKTAYIAAILEYVKHDKKMNPEKTNIMIKSVYSDYLNRSLQELIDMGGKYVEVSYSYEDIVSLIDINPDIAKKIKCKFLLSTGRDRTVKQMEQSIDSLKKGLKKGMIVGFDIMGQESMLRDKEKEYSQSKKSYSLKRKLELLIDTLKESSNGINTLRIHSGETEVSFENTEWILNTLLEIKLEYETTHHNEEILPPPEIRIGHGIYFDKNNKNYVQMLKKIGAIIEINASSNFGLKNVKSYGTIPYDYYLENGVPVVLSTDGHGLYDTSLKVEDYIAYKISKYYGVIPILEEEILEGKLRRK